MKLILISILLFFASTTIARTPEVSKGKLIYFTYKNSQFIEPREIAIWLPENYPAQRPFNVLYMHDAQSLFDTAVSWNHETWEVDETMQKLMDEQQIKNCIVVGIYNASWKRRSEFFPQNAFINLTKVMQDSMMQLKDKNSNAIFSGELNADNYLKFIVHELKFYVDSFYNTFKDPAHTFIAGSSMGALISLYALCEYPAIFGGAACLSAHWTGAGNYTIKEIPEAILLYFQEHLPDNKNHKIYFDYGRLGLDSLYNPFQNKMDQIMRSKNYDEKHWITKEFVGASHDEKAWKSRLNIPLQFLLNP